MYCITITQWPVKCEAFDVNKITLSQEILAHVLWLYNKNNTLTQFVVSGESNISSTTFPVNVRLCGNDTLYGVSINSK